MATMDIFRASAFTTTSLSGRVEKRPYRPQMLGSLNLFEPTPVRTKSIFVDRREGGLTLIPTTPDGGPPANLNQENRDVVSLRTVNLKKSSRLMAYELDGIRETGTESELQQVQREVLRRLDRLNEDMELTHEYHRLGALQGLLLDADGTSVIYDYSAEFNEAIPAATDFQLSSPSFSPLDASKDIRRSMARDSKGAFTAGVTIHALAGDDFYDALISHGKVEKFYLNQQAAAEMREAQSTVFESFRVGGITYHNYRGTDDGTTVGVPAGEAKFFPVGARDVFKVAYSPAETMAHVGQLGQRVYAMTVPDRDRDMWVDNEVHSHPLYVCQRPGLLRRGTAS